MDDRRLGTVFRTVRQRSRLRQEDVAAKARVSPTLVSRIERGHCGSVQLDRVRNVAGVLGIRAELHTWWRGGDLDRLLNARHSELHESVARYFAARYPAWELLPEVSFSVWGERGVIDIVAWHPGRRALLIIELKTDIADVNELVGVVDRKRRLARVVATEHGWDPRTLSAWVIVADGRTNRRRIAAHTALLRNAFRADGRRMSGWLAKPLDAVAALSYWPDARRLGAAREAHPLRRVRKVARSLAGER